MSSVGTCRPAAVSRHGDQPLVRRHRRGHPHVHGGAGHHHRQRRPALHRRRTVGGGHRHRVGDHQLPGRQRHHPADLRLALGPPGPPQLFPAVDRRLHHRLGAVRHGHQPGADHPVPGDPGLAGGGLQPSSQGVLLDAFPPEKQGAARRCSASRPCSAPVVGPTLGGYLTVNYDWRWIFYINVPVGVLALVVCYFVVEDPDLPEAGAGRAATQAAELRLHRPGPARPGHVLLGNHAQQGAGVGLAGRPVLAGADAADPVRVWRWAA